MLDSVIRLLEGMLSALGRAVALLVLVMMGLIIFEMVSRGAFGVSMPWTHELGSWLLTVFIFLGGPYALLRGQFVRVDIFFGRLSARGQFLIDLTFSTVLFALFVGVLLWRGSDFFLNSFVISERSPTGAWDGPVWAAKLMIPLGSALLSLAWLTHLLTSWRTFTRLPEAVHADAHDQERIHG